MGGYPEPARDYLDLVITHPGGIAAGLAEALAGLHTRTTGTERSHELARQLASE